MAFSKKNLILLDRDGVLNMDRADHVRRPTQLVMIKGAAKAVASLCRAGYAVEIVSNQSGIARGYMDAKTLNQINARIEEDIAQEGGTISAWHLCMDHPDRPTDRRKPSPGMLIEAMQARGLKPENCIFIGDAISDWKAAKATKMPFILVLTGKGKKSRLWFEQKKLALPPLAKNLTYAVDKIILGNLETPPMSADSS